MSTSFRQTLKYLVACAYQFNDKSAVNKSTYFKKISRMPIPLDQDIFEYHIVLLFSRTHAENEEILKMAEAELLRLTTFIKKHADHEMFANSGLPYTTMLTRFTQDAFNELVKNKAIHIELESLNNASFDLNTFLNISMPHILKEYTTAGMTNEDILATMGIQPHQTFDFLLNEINNLKALPLVKDFLWQSLQSFFYVKGIDKGYSKSYNRISLQDYFFHKDLIKQFNHFELIQQKIPKPKPLSLVEKESIAFVIRNSMPLAMREIDTITYMNSETLEIYPLDRGLCLALYTLIPERQLPLQSFVGYTLFKNDYPISYGGSWVFGQCSLFGLNILEEFRGGESKYLMTQILRVYIQVYNITHYEVETFQFGNKEALQTGAFWFYYKYGFRSRNEEVNKLSNKELQKINATKNYKTSISTLKKLSEYNIVLALDENDALNREDILEKINKLIVEKYNGNSRKAIDDAKNTFRKNFTIRFALTPLQEQLFEEIALWAYTFNIRDKKRLSWMYKLIFIKFTDTVAYNKLVIKIINQA